MRIAYFNANLIEGQDGVARVMYKYFKYAIERGMSAMAFGATLPPDKNSIVPMVKVCSIKFPLHKAYSLALPLYNKISYELKQFNPSLIHINSPCTLGFAAMRFARKNNIPVVATYHTHFPTYLQYYHLTGLEFIVWNILRRLYNNIDRTFVPTKTLLDELRSHRIERLEYLSNGIDTTEFNPSCFSLQWRKDVDAEHKTVLLFVSRLVWEKNIKVLADAYNMLKSKRDDFRMVIVGEGHARAELEKKMDGAFFLGYQKGEYLYRAYASSDIFLFPSTTETFGLVTAEAMASGVVPVAAKVGGAIDIIDDGISGFLTIPNSAEDMANKVDWLLNNPAKRRQMACAAIAKAQNFKWESILDKLFAKYEEVINEAESR